MEHLAGHTQVVVDLVATNRSGAGVLQHALEMGVDSWAFKASDMDTALLEKLRERGITHIVLAGFLKMIPATLLEAYSGRIINIHPSLLPKFGGKGMYGMHVHRAVKDSGAQESGMSIHLVNEVYDDGRILFQAKTALDTGDEPEDIARKVLLLEHRYYPPVIEAWILNQDMPEITQ